METGKRVCRRFRCQRLTQKPLCVVQCLYDQLKPLFAVFQTSCAWRLRREFFSPSLSSPLSRFSCATPPATSRAGATLFCRHYYLGHHCSIFRTESPAVSMQNLRGAPVSPLTESGPCQVIPVGCGSNTPCSADGSSLGQSQATPGKEEVVGVEAGSPGTTPPL